MPSAKTQPARGMRDFLPADVRRRQYVINVIREVYERYGFEPLETPAVENIETLLGKYGEEGNQLIFKILKRGEHEKTGEADLALRYDLTVPLARVVAQYQNELPKFFKRYQIQPVWRADRPARGRFREFYQCDVDVLGSRSMVVEAEICAAASDVLTTLGFNDFTIRLNHREVLAGILNAVGISSDKQNDVLVTLDKLDKSGPGAVKKELIDRAVSPKAAERLMELLTDSLQALHDDITKMGEIEQRALNSVTIARLSDFIGSHQWLRDLERIIELTNVTAAYRHVKIDPRLARGLSYYTGAIMEINVPGLTGSLGGGGRYDNLVGMFSGEDIPACGFSLGLERIIVVMTEREMFPAQLVSAPADILVSIWNEESIADSIALAQELRSASLRLRVDLYPEADKLGKQFKYASARGIPFVAVIGDDERVRGEVSIKDMRSGAQRSVKRENLAVTLRESL
jgi:histidyl-tRNA synthetase